ncbi:MAG TPA: ABC transporter permease, partial [Polyangiaceae bacterium]|nr:ABC transporter permease [Polyangiaceae bacterium]
ALGATRPRLVRQFLAESVLLALAGGLVGFALSFASVGLVGAGFRDAAYAAHALRPDARVLAFALGLSSLAGLGFGLAPAWRGSAVRLAELLKEGAARSTSSTKRRRAQGALLVAEVALSAVLLAGSAAVARGFYKTLHEPLGFASEGVLALSLHLPSARYKDAASVRAFHDGMLARLRALPSVSSVGAANFIPLSGGNTDRFFSIEGRPPQPHGQEFAAEAQRVSGDYFQAMGIGLRKGRLFTEADREQGAPVVVVDEAFARRFLPGEDPIGKRIRLSGDDQSWCEIVGVVGDILYSPWQEHVRPATYMPYAQGPVARNATFVLKSAASPAALANAARAALRELDPELPVADAKTLEVLSLEAMADRRFTLWLVTVFAASALLLTALGLFGLVSYQT